MALLLGSATSDLFAKSKSSYLTNRKGSYSYKIKKPRLNLGSYSKSKKYYVPKTGFAKDGRLTGSNYSKTYRDLFKVNRADSYYKSSGLLKERSSAAKQEFLRQHGLKEVPEGYEVDHIVPLSAGGSDDPSNMQLLPKSLHRLKTDWERRLYDWNKK